MGSPRTPTASIRVCVRFFSATGAHSDEQVAKVKNERKSIDTSSTSTVSPKQLGADQFTQVHVTILPQFMPAVKDHPVQPTRHSFMICIRERGREEEE